MKKIYIEYSSAAYVGLFQKLGLAVVDKFEEAGIVCFTGGEDVTPSFYGHTAHAGTHSNHYRDFKEQKLFLECALHNKKTVGIGRGAHFLHVMNGGKLYQHVVGHTDGYHSIQDYVTGETVSVSSKHHQAMINGPAGEPIAFEQAPSLVVRWDRGTNSFIKQEDVYIPEVMVHCSNKTPYSMCVQFHPEFAPVSRMGVYFSELLGRYILN